MKKLFAVFATLSMLFAVGCEDNGDDNGNPNNSAENNKIYYTTSDGKKLFPTNTEPAIFGAIIVSNTYKDGQGVLTFDDAVTSIGKYAYSECHSLTSITIPESVTSVNYYSFDCCSILRTVYCKATTPPSGNFCPFYTVGDNVIYVPRESVEAYKAAWIYCAEHIEGYDF